MYLIRESRSCGCQLITSGQAVIILHSRQDDVIPFGDSKELVANSGLPPEKLIEVGDDHRLADPEPLEKMLEASERVQSKT